MPQTTQLVSVFLASPTDVDNERQVVDFTIIEWNQRHSRDKGVMFDLIKWDNVAAGFGADGQDVVNNEIGDNYDLLIVVIWQRIGLETPRAQSGTVEEYERARARIMDGKDVEIAIYFKDVPINFRTADIDQIKYVKEFESKVHQDGALSKKFKDEDSLKLNINFLLDKVSRNINQGNSISSISVLPLAGNGGSSSVESEVELEDDSDEPGLWDVIEVFGSYAEKASEFLNQSTMQLEEMSEVTNESTAEIEEINKFGEGSPKVMRPILLKIGTSMDKYSEFLENNIAGYAENTNSMVESIRSLIDISYDFVRDDSRQQSLEEAIKLRDSLKDMSNSISEALTSFIDMKLSVLSTPRLTTNFNTSRRRLARNTENLIAVLTSDKILVEQAVDEVIILIKSLEENYSSMTKLQ